MVCHKGPLVVTAWRDRRIVFTLSSLHGSEQNVVSRRVDGHFTRKNYPCPEAVHDYTANMGGVDMADQLARYYLPDRKGCRWNVKLLMYLLQISVVNAFILKRCHGAPNLHLVDLFLELVEGLTSNYQQPRKHGRQALAPLDSRLYTRCLPGAFE